MLAGYDGAVPGTSPRVRGKRDWVSSEVAALGYIPACAGEAFDNLVRHLQSPVHPRVCGGSRNAGLCIGLIAGTSPRVRGKLECGRERVVDRGYIPACAGEARRAVALACVASVHPRVCGGSGFLQGRQEPELGTSPRVRGKRHPGLAERREHGYIPACAGEASENSRVVTPIAVHPRVCGGSHRPALRVCRMQGTSPRVRGKLIVTDAIPGPFRYIPACAGEARRRLCWPRRRRVHPRVCGGSFRCPCCGGLELGTSPRVRGKRPGLPRHHPGTGYIPACAGEATRTTTTSSRDRVHPRVCGGSSINELRYGIDVGTSPRVRGKRSGGPCGQQGIRYIPACAGEASRHRPTLGAARVHPRVCGGSAIHIVARHPEAGTSPRVRGKRWRKKIPIPNTRYIPACAGEALRATATRLDKWVHPRVCGGSPRSPTR